MPILSPVTDKSLLESVSGRERLPNLYKRYLAGLRNLLITSQMVHPSELADPIMRLLAILNTCNCTAVISYILYYFASLAYENHTFCFGRNGNVRERANATEQYWHKVHFLLRKRNHITITIAFKDFCPFFHILLFSPFQTESDTLSDAKMRLMEN